MAQTNPRLYKCFLFLTFRVFQYRKQLLTSKNDGRHLDLEASFDCTDEI